MLVIDDVVRKGRTALCRRELPFIDDLRFLYREVPELEQAALVGGLACRLASSRTYQQRDPATDIDLVLPEMPESLAKHSSLVRKFLIERSGVVYSSMLGVIDMTEVNEEKPYHQLELRDAQRDDREVVPEIFTGRIGLLKVPE